MGGIGSRWLHFSLSPIRTFFIPGCTNLRDVLQQDSHFRNELQRPTGRVDSLSLGLGSCKQKTHLGGRSATMVLYAFVFRIQTTDLRTRAGRDVLTGVVCQRSVAFRGSVDRSRLAYNDFKRLSTVTYRPAKSRSTENIGQPRIAFALALTRSAVTFFFFFITTVGSGDRKDDECNE